MKNFTKTPKGRAIIVVAVVVLIILATMPWLWKIWLLVGGLALFMGTAIGLIALTALTYNWITTGEWGWN